MTVCGMVDVFYSLGQFKLFSVSLLCVLLFSFIKDSSCFINKIYGSIYFVVSTIGYGLFEIVQTEILIFRETICFLVLLF